MKKYKPYDWTLLEDLIVYNTNSKITSNIFDNQNSELCVEIGCGNGHFLTDKALNNPEKNYIGIEIKIGRIVRCIEKKVKNNLKNIKYINNEANFALDFMFEDDSIDLIYMTFPDPWPKRRHHKNRLFSEKFLDSVFKKMKYGGLFVFITDHEEYFKYSSDILIKDIRFEKIERISSNAELSNSLFGEKWKKENRKFYTMEFKKR
ncbi:MAG: tRNA (guanine-N(7)-)-methyltransferase [Spirochaetes bacterium ADurb.Bin133]|jgi:tRNA (guanine-N7-)-methyltransferase|nr:MAG: tRNA (guanine-N(7)-)-methyltransferase [Spirochaetes bacterium ADurb.Bin133]